MVETTFNLREVFVLVEISVRMKPIRQLDKVDLHLSYTFNSALIKQKNRARSAINSPRRQWPNNKKLHTIQVFNSTAMNKELSY